MCGIMGYYAFGDKRPSKERLDAMLLETSTRGIDATGYAYIKDNQLIVAKAGIPARKFLTTPEYLRLFETGLPKVFMAHCRAKTQGCEKNNTNNHPIYSRSGIAIIHNGIISNDTEVFKKKKYERNGKVDSEAILRCLEEKLVKNRPLKYKDIIKAVKNTSLLTGSFAVACISTMFPDKLILFRRTSPIVLGYDKRDDILYFGSTEDIISIENKNVYRGIVWPSSKSENFLTAEIDDDTAFIFGANGCEKSFDFYEFSRSIDRDYSSWRKQTQSRFGFEKERRIKIYYPCKVCGMSFAADEGTPPTIEGGEGVCDWCKGRGLADYTVNNDGTVIPGSSRLNVGLS